MAEILIIDDDIAFSEGLAETLGDLGHAPHCLSSGKSALKEMEDARGLDHYGAIFLDLRMPPPDGLQVLRALQADPDSQAVPVVVLTAYADSANTIEAMKLGAFDHLSKPINRAVIEDVLARALNRPRFKKELTATPRQSGGRLLGSCPSMRQVQKLIGLAAASDATVLILGETGTGKEEVARSLHEHSARGSKPFVAVNCAAIPSELLESELFGHVKGAFTGASSPRQGKFQEADKGTLFLDEIGDMPLFMQTKILRALETRTVTAIGATSSQRLDLRIVAATHRDLIAAVRDGTFREDLYYRLNVVSINLPPLRERGSDILVLAEHFLEMAKPGHSKILHPKASSELLKYHWPGNVRELRNVMQKVSVTTSGQVVQISDLGLRALESEENRDSSDFLEFDFHTAVGRLEKRLLEKALIAADGNRSRAATLLKMRRQLFYAKLREHKLI